MKFHIFKLRNNVLSKWKIIAVIISFPELEGARAASDRPPARSGNEIITVIRGLDGSVGKSAAPVSKRASVRIFFTLYFLNGLSWVYNCDDLPFA